MTKKMQISVVTFMLMVAMSLTSAAPCQAATIYVDSSAGGANDGSSWLDAYNDLQNALDDAVTNDEIWVAAGTYYPTSDYGLGIGDRGKHFRMINGVAIYGGFPMGGDIFAERDPNQFETILSGDLLDNDNPTTPVDGLPDDPTRTDNCYHVFYHPDGLALTADAILDGFTITGGNADLYPHRDGGGMFNDSSSPTVSSCIFTGNSAMYGGGGMSNSKSSPTVIRCTFTGNSSFREGGGITNRDSSPTVISCTFTGNSALVAGGMLNSYDSSPTVTNCIFSSNLALHYGGGMYNYYSSSPTVTGCTFSGNSAEQGGGMSNIHNSSPTVISCTFTGNWARRKGGGMMNHQASSPTVISCTFTGNSTDYGDGGGMYNRFKSSPTVMNCSFSGNSAQEGGGMMNYQESSPTVISCTFSGNSADEGGGIYNRSGSNSTITNCILWDNTAYSRGNEIYGSYPTISYCDIAGWDIYMGTDGGGNIDIDPLFVNPNGADGIIGTEDDNLRLQAGSPCIDAGDPDYVAEPDETDLDGNPRTLNGRIDMGAYEFGIPNTPPMADAGGDIAAYACVDGFGVVEPNGFESYDLDGDELSYRWSWEIGGEVFEANGVMPLVLLPVGDHTLELVVFDGALYSEPDLVLVTVVAAVEARGFVVPRVLNLSSRGNYVMAVLYLPEGVGVDDVKGGSFGLYVDGAGGSGVAALWEWVYAYRSTGRVIVVFDRAAVIEVAHGQSSVKLYIAGELESGECIYGSDTIRVVRGQRRVPRRTSGGRARSR